MYALDILTASKKEDGESYGMSFIRFVLEKTVTSVWHALSFSHLLSLLVLLKQSTWWRNSYRKAFHDIDLSVFPFMEHVFCVKSNKPSYDPES